MSKNRGRVVHNIIKRSGFKINEIAKKLEISRGSLYNYFNNPELSFEFILRLGKIVQYDFSIHFEELNNPKKPEESAYIKEYEKQKVNEITLLQRKYYILLEQYNLLLKFLIKTADNSNSKELKKRLAKFVDNDVDSF